MAVLESTSPPRTAPGDIRVCDPIIAYHSESDGETHLKPDVQIQADRLNEAIANFEVVLNSADLRFAAHVALDDDQDLIWRRQGGQWKIYVGPADGGKNHADPLLSATLSRRVAAVPRLSALYEAVLLARDAFLESLPAARAEVDALTARVLAENSKS